NQPQARNPQKLRKLHSANPGKTRLLAPRSGNGTLSPRLEDFEPRRRRADESRYRSYRAALHEIAGGKNSPDRALGRVGPWRSRLHRKSGSPRVLQGQYLGGAADVFAFHQRRQMPAGLAPEA